MPDKSDTDEDFTPGPKDEKLADWLSKALRERWRKQDEEEEAAAPPAEEPPVRRGFASWWTGAK